MTEQRTTDQRTTPQRTATGPVGTVVDRFLEAVAAANIADATDLYAADATLDLVVPNWRASVSGEAAIRAEYGRWFADPGSFEEMTRSTTSDGEVVEYTLSWMEHGVPHGARHVHVLRIDRTVDRIVGDHVWCGGRWPASLLAEMGAVVTASSVAS